MHKMSLRDTLPAWFVVKELEDRGGQGVLIRASDSRLTESQPHRESVLLKCIPRGESVTAELHNEVLTQRHLWHKHIIGFREVFLTTTHLCLVFDDADGGSVCQFLQEKKRLPEDFSRWVFQQLIMAVDYLHKLNVTKLDINLSKLLFATEGGSPIVMCDIGFASMISTRTDSHLGPTYMAPDYENGQMVDPVKADVWSCGVCLFYMLYGALFTMKHKHQDGRVSCEEPEVLIPDRVNGNGDIASEECRDFLKRILEVNPGNRISMDDIWMNKWFRTNLPEQSREYNTLTTNIDMLREHYGDVQSLDGIACILERAKRPGSPVYVIEGNDLTHE